MESWVPERESQAPPPGAADAHPKRIEEVRAALAAPSGVAVIRGAPGRGKTCILRAVAVAEASRRHVVFLPFLHFAAEEVASFLLGWMGLDTEGGEPALCAALRESDLPILLLIDEAQSISSHTATRLSELIALSRADVRIAIAGVGSSQLDAVVTALGGTGKVSSLDPVEAEPAERLPVAWPALEAVRVTESEPEPEPEPRTKLEPESGPGPECAADGPARQVTLEPVAASSEGDEAAPAEAESGAGPAAPPSARPVLASAGTPQHEMASPVAVPAAESCPPRTRPPVHATAEARRTRAEAAPLGKRIVAVLIAAVFLLGVYVVGSGGPPSRSQVGAADPATLPAPGSEPAPVSAPAASAGAAIPPDAVPGTRPFSGTRPPSAAEAAAEAVSPHQLVHQFHAAVRRADLGHVRWHDLRHSCASLALAAGTPVHVVAQRLATQAPQQPWRFMHTVCLINNQKLVKRSTHCSTDPVDERNYSDGLR